MQPRDVLNRLLRDEKERARLAGILKGLFKIFLKDWFRWEVMGWILALHMGFSREEIEAAPELGWFAKVALALALLQSPKQDERLLGRALLYHTELPPDELFVLHGGELLPSVIYHYRTSFKSEKVWKDVDDVARQVDELLRE